VEDQDEESQSLEEPQVPAEEPLPQLVPARGHFTVVEQVHYQPVGEQAMTVFGDGHRYSHEVDEDEQPYERHLTATEEWKPLDMGWISRCGQLLLRNDEGNRYLVNPTEQEKAETAKKVIEVAFLHGYDERDALLVPPRESMRVYPKDASRLIVRCQKGKAHYTLALLPE
jgi:hypothetical protein